tara:strand:- start:1428 stop:1571 length:144 start_codon:yes stop_codon:yes gene_type:complete
MQTAELTYFQTTDGEVFKKPVKLLQMDYLLALSYLLTLFMVLSCEES